MLELRNGSRFIEEDLFKLSEYLMLKFRVDWPFLIAQHSVFGPRRSSFLFCADFAFEEIESRPRRDKYSYRLGL